jgi:hypothetical protein
VFESPVAAEAEASALADDAASTDGLYQPATMHARTRKRSAKGEPVPNINIRPKRFCPPYESSPRCLIASEVDPIFRTS